MKLPRSDTVRACRLQRGILFEGATAEQAEAAVDVLRGFNVEAVAVPDDDLPIMPKPLHVSLARIDDDGLATPSIRSPGLPDVWQWRDLALLSGGIIVDPQALTAGLFDKVEEAGFSDADDRRSMAARALEKARGRVFPLRAEIAAGRDGMADALEAALVRRGGLSEYEVDGFGRVETVIDLVFHRPFERLRLTGASRIGNRERTGNKARELHAAVHEIAGLTPFATHPGATLALADGADSGEYVFEDLGQFDNYCRWVYYWRLRLEAEGAESDNDDDPES